MDLYRPLADPDIIDELRGQSDRGAAIIGGSIVEAHLLSAVQSRLRPLSKTRQKILFTGFGPLAGFSAKIEVGYALGIFGEKAHQDLKTVKDIRNDFAHRLEDGPWSFGHPNIAKLCDRLFLVENFPHIWGVPPKKNTKERFIRTVFVLSLQLDGEAIANRPAPHNSKFLSL
jgi:hypothetical protein